MSTYLPPSPDTLVDFSLWLGTAPLQAAQNIASTPKTSDLQYSQTFDSGYTLEFIGIFSDYKTLDSGLKFPGNAAIYEISLHGPADSNWVSISAARNYAISIDDWITLPASTPGKTGNGISNLSEIDLHALLMQDRYLAPLMTGGTQYGNTDLSPFFTHANPATEITYLLQGADAITGGSKNDRFVGYGGNDWLQGGPGIDTAVYSGLLENYQLNHYGISPLWKSTLITDKRILSGLNGDGQDSLADIERLEFSDYKLALDLDGNAGKVAGLLQLVFGDVSRNNASKAGTALKLLDDHITDFAGLANLALSNAGLTDNGAIVNRIWQGLFGTAPSAAETKPIVAALDNGLAPATLTTLAVDYWLNHDGLKLIGIADTGLVYL